MFYLPPINNPGPAHPAMPPRPVTQFLTHVGTLLTALLTRVTTSGDPAPRLGEPLTTLLRTRLTDIAHAIRAILTTQFTGRTRPARHPNPRFHPAILSVSASDPDAKPPREKAPRLPSHYRWLTKLFPEFLPDRHALEDRLREQDVKDAIAADPRLAKAIRKLAWMLGVQRNLIPPGPPRGQVLLLVGCSVEQARGEYRDGLKTMSHDQVLRKHCMFPDHPFQVRMREVSRDKRHNHDKRPVWLGGGLKPPELQPIPYPLRT